MSDMEKLIFLGSSGTGKTSLCKALQNTPPSEEETVTIGVDFFETRVYQPYNNSSLRLQCWDTAGQEKYRSLVSLYYQNINIVCLVFALNNASTLYKLDSWIQELSFFYPHIKTPHKPPGAVQVILIGNKTDLRQQRSVTFVEASHFAALYGMKYIECSSFDRQSLNTLIDTIAQASAQRRKVVSAHTFKPRKPSIHNMSAKSTKCCTLL